MLKLTQNNLLLIAIALIVLILIWKAKQTESFKDFAHSFGIRKANIPGYQGDDWEGNPKTEFMAWNVDGVPDMLTEQDTPVNEKDQILLEAFRKIMQSANKSEDYGNWHQIYSKNADREQLSKFVVEQINKASSRTFEPLDVVAFRTEIKRNVGETKDIYKYTSTLFITEQYSENVNNWSKQIYYEAIGSNGKLELVRIELLGNNRDGLQIVPGNDPNSNSYFKILSKYHIQQPYTTSEDRVLFDDEATDRHLRDYYRKARETKYSCFSEGEMTLPLDTQGACLAAGGKWDSPPENSADCPYYKVNPHYPNERGGLAYDGTCEMPLGTKKIGYRHTSNDPQHLPFCYNCKDDKGNIIGIGQCCDEQANNTSRYPELQGKPDYMFRSDITERYNAREELAEKGLKWERYPNRIFEKNLDVHNLPQLNPVFNKTVGLKRDQNITMNGIPYNSM